MTPDPTHPRVSCLLVALPDPRRFPLFRRSIGAYFSQSYPNRELVVVLDQGPAVNEFRRYVEQRGRPDIRVHIPGRALSLGALRNASLAQANGDFVCQWDDDDIYHPDRITEQLKMLSAASARACYLEDVLQWYPSEGAAYWTNFARTAAHCHPATLLCSTQLDIAYPDSGPNPKTRSGEDDVFCRALSARHPVALLRGRPDLYVYVSHGLNAMGPEHHRVLAESLTVSNGRVARHEQALRAGLSRLAPLLPAVAVKGRDGLVFYFDAAT